MERWVGKVAVVTGASAGIGAAIAIDLVKAGLIVVGLARRKERVEELRSQIPSDATGKLHAFKCDVSNDAEVVAAFAWISSTFGAIHVLVNNAGIVKLTSITDENNEEAIKSVLQTNVWGLVLCTKKAVEIMKREKVVGAHIININSVLGHRVADSGKEKNAFNLYPASKFAVTALTETLRQEFRFDNLGYKVTSLSPGVVRTEILDAAMYKLMNVPELKASDISAAVLYILGTPEHVQIAELIIKPLGELM